MNQNKEEVLACNNDICFKKNECKRYQLFLDGAKEYKTNNGKPHKGCGKFIQKDKGE
jgi:hypothetical protein